MTRAQVVGLINGYKLNEAAAGHAKVRLSELSPLLEELTRHASYYATSTTGAYGTEPGGGGKVESKVEKLALTLADGRLPGGLDEIRRECEALRAEIARRTTCLEYVRAWMGGLNDREYMVLWSHMVEAHTWREVSAEYERQYGLEYSRTGLKSICMRALDKIYAIAGASV